MTESYSILSRSFSAKLADEARVLESNVWEHLGFLNHTKAHHSHYDDILADYDELQLCLIDDATGELVALANCVPAFWDGGALPATGWDWLVEDGGRHPARRNNALGALAISVSPARRNAGLARRMIGELKRLCEQKGYETLIAPVRPSQKHLYPTVAMSDYVRWTDDRGRCFDPWLRSHLHQDARVVSICEHSMVVEQQLGFWETWAGRRFTQSGRYVLDGGLVPIEIDVPRQAGTYQEPNVWVAYRH